MLRVTGDQGAGDAVWAFDEPLTGIPAWADSLLVNGQTPLSSFLDSQGRLQLTYTTPPVAGDPWSIAPAPPDDDPPISPGQSGSLVYAVLAATTATPTAVDVAWDFTDDLVTTAGNNPQLQISDDGTTWLSPISCVVSTPAQIVATYAAPTGTATLFRVLTQPTHIATPLSLPQQGPTS